MLEGCCKLKSQHTEIAKITYYNHSIQKLLHVGYATPQCMQGYKSLPNPHDSVIVCKCKAKMLWVLQLGGTTSDISHVKEHKVSIYNGW